VPWNYIQSYNNGYFKNTEIDPIHSYPYYGIGALGLLLMFGVGFLTKSFLSKKTTHEQGVQETEITSYPFSILKGGLSTGNIVTKYQYESINNSETNDRL